MSELRVVFMGTPDFAVPCLKILAEAGYEVAAVVTQPDRARGRGQKLAPSPVKEIALAYALPLLQPEKINDGEFLASLALLKPDLIVAVAFGQLLTADILSLPPLGCVNVHASLLPKYRGAAPVHRAVINGERVSGVTTMYMGTGLDTGDLILQAQIPVSEDMTTGELYDSLKELGAKTLLETVRLLEKGEAPRRAQEHNSATYAAKLTRETEKIDWRKPASEIHNLVRGLNPYPACYGLRQGKTLKIYRAQVSRERAGKSECGRVTALTENGFLVETGDGLLEVLEVQPESKRRMGAGEYARGYFLNTGEILN